MSDTAIKRKTHEELEELKALVVRTKCCNKIVTAYGLPDAYTNAEYMRDIRKEAKAGHLIETVSANVVRSDFGRCECGKQMKLKL